MKKLINLFSQNNYILILFLIVVWSVILNGIVFYKFRILQKDNKAYIEFSKKIFAKFSDNLRLRIDGSMFVYFNKLDSIQFNRFVDVSNNYVYLEESQCSTCIVELKEIKDSNLIYLVFFEHEKWYKWLKSNILINQEVYYFKKPLVKDLKSVNPLILKIEDSIITKVAPLNETTAQLAIYFFHNNSF